MVDASRGAITSCIKIDKPLVAYRFWYCCIDGRDNAEYIRHNLSVSMQKSDFQVVLGSRDK